MNLATLFQQSKQSFWEFWAARDARERNMLAATAVMVGLALIYLTLIDPALSGRAQTNKNLPLLRQQVAQMQAMAKEATAFSATPANSLQATLSRELIVTTMTGKGLPTQNVTVSGDQVTVQLATASFAATVAWLDEIQKSARLAVVEANIVALEQPDMINAKLTLRQARMN